MFTALALSAALCLAADATPADKWLPDDYQLRNIGEFAFPTPARQPLPIVVPPFEEQVRVPAPQFPSDTLVAAKRLAIDAQGALQLDAEPLRKLPDGRLVKDLATVGADTWFTNDEGLYHLKGATGEIARQEHFGVDGPLATHVTALAGDTAGDLWVGTPIGLSRRAPDGTWTQLRGKDGLPVEDITALAAAPNGEDLWIGTSRGAVLYRPNAEGRKWFYRQGPRYLPGDQVRAIAIAPDSKSVYFLTDAGLGAIALQKTTLLARAQAIEARINERHRRLGMVASCILDDAENPTSHTIHDNDNDGLWTAYHVAALSLAYGATHDEAAKKSATESMHALYMLQNASGIPGCVARSVLPPELGAQRDKQWQPTPDGKMYWKSDTSSDEIDGHYLAFYTFYEHIAQHDPAERALLEKQLRALTDYIVGNGYQLIDYNGKRTRWGFWDPKSLNYNPTDYTECGLNSLQMLSFLKVTQYITGDAKYAEHYRRLAVDEHYLQNVMLTKKAYPQENNHSDDQLGFVAWYPILQLEKDPRARQALLRGVRYHYEVVRPEQPSFYTFAYATINPGGADLLGGVENLRQIPTDRRTWKQENSHRADVEFDKHPNRFNKPVLDRVVPVDERVFEKWNADPYVPDDGGDGRHEDDGAAFLLPYWMARFHGFIAEE